MPSNYPSTYIHGTESSEQDRLRLLNRITNPPFIAWLNLRGSERVLEVGSGLGLLASEVAALLTLGSVEGIEYSAKQLEACNSGRNVHFRRGDAHALPFAKGEFDVVYCRYLLEHVADPQRVVCEMARVTRAGGRVFAQENDISLLRLDPACPMFDLVWDTFIELQKSLGGDGCIGRRLFGLFKRAGLEDVSLSLQPQIHWYGEETFKDWLINIAGNVESARNTLITQAGLNASQVDFAIEELQSLATNPEASCIFHWNRAQGRVKDRL